MASDQTEKSAAEGAGCMPCDGRGTVISHLGGESRQLPCPWCEGTGERLQGIDAQARWADGLQRPDAGGADGLAQGSGGNGASAPSRGVQASNQD